MSGAAHGATGKEAEVRLRPTSSSFFAPDFSNLYRTPIMST